MLGILFSKKRVSKKNFNVIFSNQRKISFGAYLGFLIPGLEFSDSLLSLTNSVLLWAAIIIGVIASLMVFHNAYKIGGGVIRGVYNRFAIGMFLVVAALVTTAVPEWAPSVVVLQIHYGLFILGFTIMAFGAKRLLTAAGLA